MKLKKSILAIFFITIIIPIFSEELPRGFHNIELGMSLEETKSELLKDYDFGYHGDSDVSLLPGINKTLIETDTSRSIGSPFLERCYFQFSEERLYIITININTEKMDYYSIFTTLCNKYGNPQNLNPNSATWQNDDVTMSLEKPLTLKYIDNQIFEELKQYSNIEKSGEEKTRQMFLDEL